MKRCTNCSKTEGVATYVVDERNIATPYAIQLCVGCKEIWEQKFKIKSIVRAGARFQ